MFLRAHEIQLFTNRQATLAELHRNSERYAQGLGDNLALIGRRRVGKTLVLHKFADELLACPEHRRRNRERPILPIYFDIERNLTLPAIFASRFFLTVGETCLRVIDQAPERSLGLLSLTDLLSVAYRSDVPTLIEVGERFLREMEKAQIDERLLLELAFECLEPLARDIDSDVMVILDEFQSITDFDRYPQIRNVLGLLRGVMSRQEKVHYIVAGSSVRMMEQILQQAESPLFGQFRLLSLPPFDRDDTAQLLRKLLPQRDVPARVVGQVYHFTNGHPFYINCLGSAIHQLSAGEEITPETVERAIYAETMMKTGRIYQYCNYVLETSLRAARGQTTLRSVMLLLADEGPLTSSQASRRLRRQAGQINNYFRRLLDYDLIVREGNEYHIVDPVLAMWIKYALLEAVPEYEAFRTSAETYLAQLRERVAALSTELGQAQESVVRELLEELAGHTVEGSWFGQSGELEIPPFVHVGRYRSEDGQVEVDALAEMDSVPSEGKASERWAVEVKWRNRAAGVKELRSLQHKAEKLGARGWCISKMGFTAQALEWGREQGLLLSTAKDLQALRQLTGQAETDDIS